MLETNDVLLVVLVCSVISLFVGVFCAFIARMLQQRELDLAIDQAMTDLQQEKSKIMAQKGNYGNEVKAEKAARLNEAAGRAAQLFLEEKSKLQEGEELNILNLSIKLIPQLMGEYPDVALQIPSMLSKMSKGL